MLQGKMVVVVIPFLNGSEGGIAYLAPTLFLYSGSHTTHQLMHANFSTETILWSLSHWISQRIRMVFRKAFVLFFDVAF